MSISFINKIKETLSDRLKVFVFEEMATVANNDNKIEFLLNFLDGANSIDRSIAIGLTNHPEKIPSNIMDRPGRFDELYKFDNPKGEDLFNILKFYLGREPTKGEIDACNGSSAAALQQAVIFSKIKKISVEKAVDSFKKRRDLVKNDFATPKVMGIGSPFDDDDY